MKLDIYRTLWGVEAPLDSIAPSLKNVGFTGVEARVPADKLQRKQFADVKRENAEKVRLWLSTAAKVPGLIGFAVGRTIFWEPLKACREGKITPEQASDQIGQNYKGFCDLWQSARNAT